MLQLDKPVYSAGQRGESGQLHVEEANYVLENCNASHN